MTPGKRVMDVALALVLTVLLAPAMAVVGLAILIRDGRPVFYISERMKSPDRGFDLVKFRTMRTAADDRGVSGGDKEDRVTATGHWLRRYRLDEIPQLWNILRGDMSFVGPRPPLRRYVEMFPDLYSRVLTARPGVTGLATLMLHRREARLLAPCTSADETEAVYLRRCVPIKARLDLIYGRNRGLCWDAQLILATALGRRARSRVLRHRR